MLNITLDDKDVQNIIIGLKGAITTLECVALFSPEGSGMQAEARVEAVKIRGTLHRIETYSGK